MKKKGLLIPLALLLIASLVACAAPAPEPAPAPAPTTTVTGPATTVTAPAPAQPAEVIRWRFQTYAGPALSEHIAFKQLRQFNEIAQGRMVIEMYTADELVPMAEVIPALQAGTIDLVVGSEEMWAPNMDIAVVSGYFPLMTSMPLEAAVLWEYKGLAEIWAEAYAEVPGVTWLSGGGWDPNNLFTKTKVAKYDDLKGMKVFGYPSIAEFLEPTGLIQTYMPVEDVEMAVETGMLDGTFWNAFTEQYTIGWADVTDYVISQPFTGTWLGSFLASTESWEVLPDDLKQLLMLTLDAAHYYRNVWYYNGEVEYRVYGGKLEVVVWSDEEWQKILDLAPPYYEKVAARNPTAARVIDIVKKYQKDLEAAGPPFRW